MSLAILTLAPPFVSNENACWFAQRILALIKSQDTGDNGAPLAAALCFAKWNKFSYSGTT